MNREIIQKQKEALMEEKLDALVALSPENVAYSLGFMVPSHPIMPRRHAASIVTLDSEAVLVANMEQSTTERYSVIKNVHAYVEFLEEPMEALANLIRKMGLSEGRIGIEMNYIPAGDYEKIRSYLPRCSFVACDELFVRLRMVKTKYEINKLRKIARIADEIHANVYTKVQPGDTEKDLAAHIINELIRRGGDNISVLVVGSGDRSGLPNAKPTDKKIMPNEIIRVDILGTLDNYYSDVARTVVVGEPNPKQKEIWNKIYDTHQAVLSKIRAGVTTSEIYDVFKRKFEHYGFPVSNFVGHGIGLHLHEEPLIGRFGENHVLEEGMVLCIEPFIFADNYGYHVEDQVLVTKNGYELLSNCTDTSKLLTTG